MENPRIKIKQLLYFWATLIYLNINIYLIFKWLMSVHLIMFLFKYKNSAWNNVNNIKTMGQDSNYYNILKQ